MVTAEEQSVQDCQRRYKEFGSDFDDARTALNEALNALRKWKEEHPDYDILDPWYVCLRQKVKDADERFEKASKLLNRIGQMVQNALQRLANARAATRNVTPEPPVQLLTAIDPNAQIKLCKYVVRISSPSVVGATALVVDKTATHLYLLTNLNLWVDDEFAPYLSSDFKDEIEELKLINKLLETTTDIESPSVQPDGKVQAAAKVKPDQPEIHIEQLQESGMVEAFKFKLRRKICWKSSGNMDFAIFRIPLPEQELSQLSSCPLSIRVYPRTNVHILGFPTAAAAPAEPTKLGHVYANIPGVRLNQMILKAFESSAPGLSETGIMCDFEGVVLGYLGGGFERTSNNEHWQAYAFTMHGLPLDLPRYLPRPYLKKRPRS